MDDLEGMQEAKIKKPGSGPGDRFKTLGVRTAVAAAGIPLMIGAAWLGGWWLFALVLALSLLGYREFTRLTSGEGGHASWIWGGVGVPLVVLYFQLPGFPPAAAALWLIGLITMVLAGSETGDPVRPSAVSLAGLAYVPVMLGHLILLRAINPPGGGFLSHLASRQGPDRGFKVLLLTMALVWICDTGAYFSGLLFGRHKLAPTISPNKTVEGLAGGAVVTAAAAIGLDAWWRLGFGPWHGLALALLITVFGTMGDLVESRLKRAAGAKDSGSLLPGHGGVLDRFDSLMFAAPAVYWYIKIVLW